MDRPRRRLKRCVAAVLVSAFAGLSYDLYAQTAAGTRAQLAAAISAQGPITHRGTPDHGATQALRAVYAHDADAPLWSQNGRPTSQAQSLLHELQQAGAYGLQPTDYGAEAIGRLSEAPAGAGDDARWAQFDVRLSAAALHFLSDLHYGRVDPLAAGFHLEGAHDELDLAAALEALSRTSDITATLAAAEPPFYHYQLLKEALARYRALAQHPELTQLPALRAAVKPGDSYAGAAALRSLLQALGDLPRNAPAPPGGLTLDEDLSAGVRNFQARHGLTADGVLGKGTFAELTTPLAQRVRQIELTLERWRWLPPFRTPPIIVNIPQFRLFAFRTMEDRVADIQQMDVIVGRTFPRNQTPVFEADMRFVVFRPYWDVPYSITRTEMLPKIRANPGYLAAQHLEIVRGEQDSSPAVPATAENIQSLADGTLRLRQLPGEDNALGLIKFMFPNSYNVYLHSTPAHRLFKEPVRAFSHGCIRVSDPVTLAEYVLNSTPGEWSREKIQAAMDGGATVRVNLARPINVLILYGTALATEAGPTLFFDDIYGYDRKLEHQLDLAPLR